LTNPANDNKEAIIANVGFINGKMHITEVIKGFSKSPNEVMMDITLCSKLT
jgi:hypothetical protein